MSKSLIRLVDEAILPAFLIIGLKAIAIAFINSILSLSFYYQNFGKIYYTKTINVIQVNTYSDLLVYFGILAAVIFILIKLLYFSDNKTSPSMLLRLAKANKVHFIQTSVELYHILFVWMVFLTGLTIYIIIRCLTFADYPVLMLPAVICYLVICWVIIKEIERDIVKKLEFGKNTLV